MKKFKEIAEFGQTFVLSGTPILVALPLLVSLTLIVKTKSIWIPIIGINHDLLIGIAGLLLCVSFHLIISRFLVAPISGLIFKLFVVKKYDSITLKQAEDWLRSDRKTSFKFE